MKSESLQRLSEQGDATAKLIIEAAESDGDSKNSEFFLKGFELAASEFHNSELIDWRRARSLIEHENHLVNHRITWLLISQGALLTPFGLIYIQYSKATTENERGLYVLPLLVLAAIGPIVCLLVYVYLRNAAIQTFRVTKWWYRSVYEKKGREAMKDEIDKIHKNHPPLHYWRQIERDIYDAKIMNTFFFRVESIPIYFIGFWFALISAGILQSAFPTIWKGTQSWLADNGFIFAGGIILGAIIYSLLLNLYKRRAANP